MFMVNKNVLVEKYTYFEFETMEISRICD